jgi:hypothetical protein
MGTNLTQKMDRLHFLRTGFCRALPDPRANNHLALSKLLAEGIFHYPFLQNFAGRCLPSCQQAEDR